MPWKESTRSRSQWRTPTANSDYEIGPNDFKRFQDSWRAILWWTRHTLVTTLSETFWLGRFTTTPHPAQKWKLFMDNLDLRFGKHSPLNPEMKISLGQFRHQIWAGQWARPSWIPVSGCLVSYSMYDSKWNVSIKFSYYSGLTTNNSRKALILSLGLSTKSPLGFKSTLFSIHIWD